LREDAILIHTEKLSEYKQAARAGFLASSNLPTVFERLQKACKQNIFGIS
jgi:hypothetical protein